MVQVRGYYAVKLFPTKYSLLHYQNWTTLL